MPPTSPTASALALRLLASARAGAAPHAGRDAPDSVEAAARVGRHLAVELSRSFGPFGYHALVTRALVEARTAHPVLRAVQVGAPPAHDLDGLTDAARAHGAGAATAGVAAVLAALIDLLGRLIGEDLAVTFIDHTIMAMASADANAAPGSDPTDASGPTSRPPVPGAP